MLRLALITGILVALLGTTAPVVRAASADLGVSATIPSWGFCNFRSAGYNLDFASLDPANPVDVQAQADLQFRCLGWPTVTYYISHDSGQHGSGPNSLRMKHLALDEYLPYALSLNPVSGTIPTPFLISAWQTLQVTGTIFGSDYQTAAAGQYVDSVVLTIVP